jgi:endonuclease-8
VPEGHTLHRLATTLGDTFAGRPVRVSSPQGRFAESAALLDGRVLETSEAYGKHLFLAFGAGPAQDVVHVHLGLYGRFDVNATEDAVPDPVGQVRLRLVGGAAYADLRGATACELLTPAERDGILARLGPDPLRPGADPGPAWERVRRSRAPVAGLLMDQSVVAGVGNVYRAELLFRHRVDPFRPGRSLRARQWQ